MINKEGLMGVLDELIEERDKAMRKWNVQSHPDGTEDTSVARFLRDNQIALVNANAKAGESNWFDILLEEVYEARCETDIDRLSDELTQVMQVCCVWKEDIQRRKVMQEARASLIEHGVDPDVVDGLLKEDLEDPIESDDNDMPGMWSHSDLSGGEADNANQSRSFEEEERVMREVAGRVSTAMSPALRSLAKGYYPGRQFLLDNIHAMRMHSLGRDPGDLDALKQLEQWVAGLPGSWWDANKAEKKS